MTVLHHDRIKQRFGDNRCFIRCDQFPTSCAHFLSRLSKVTGAGVENPEDLAVLRPFLSSKEALIVLDNAESILDPQGTDGEEIYGVVEELSQFGNIWLWITSRISTVPPDCQTFDIPTLTIEAARDTFYRIYKHGGQPPLVDKILDQLDFHPLSITLLATAAHQSKWGTDRLAREWETRRTSALQTRHSKSLAAAIELSLASPMFRGLGPNAREILGVVAFFPQGVNEGNLEWLFPAIPNRADFFDTFCVLSLTHRNNGFITMLAPLRDYLSPKDPKSSLVLCRTKEHYFTRMSVTIDPGEPNFGETRWIVSEDVNVEHLLDVFTTIDASSASVWRACADFMEHLYWHKERLVVLKPKIEGLPDDHPYKARCLAFLSRLFASVGNRVESKQLLTHVLKLRREQGEDCDVALTLMELSEINRDPPEDGIPLAKEALEIYERLGNAMGQAQCLVRIALLLCLDKQLDAAEEAASRAINLTEEGNRFLACQSHRILGETYWRKGEAEKAIHHFEITLGIASSLSLVHELYYIHCALSDLFLAEGRFDDALEHLEQARLHAVDSAYNLGRVMARQAVIWRRQGRLEEARSEALHVTGIFEKLGAARDLEWCREFIQDMQEELDNQIALDRTT